MSKSIHVVAAELAALVPAMAQDGATNNEALILQKLRELVGPVTSDAMPNNCVLVARNGEVIHARIELKLATLTPKPNA